LNAQRRWFDSTHDIACPTENTMCFAHEFSYRFDKVVLSE